MKFKKIWSLLCFLGVPWIPLIAAGLYILDWRFGGGGGTSPPFPPDLEELKKVLGFGWFSSILIFGKNCMWIGTGRTYTFANWLDRYKPQPKEVNPKRKEAQNPEIPSEFLSLKPEGLVLGKYNRFFVRVPLKRNLVYHTLIMGLPGSGKSSLLLTMLLYQFHKEGKDPMTFFVTDLKPELAIKSCMIKGNPKVHVLNPLDRSPSSYGWDVFANLSPACGEDELFSELDEIVRVLIDVGNERNVFFTISGRNVVSSILAYAYLENMSFMSGIDFLMDDSIEAVIQDVLEKTEGKPQYQRIRRRLKPYAGKTGEAMEGIALAIYQNLSVMQKSSTRWFFQDCPRMASCQDLEQSVSLFFALPEDHIDEMAMLLKLVTAQIIRHCSSRPEKSHLIHMVLDEFPRWGGGESGIASMLQRFLATARSRNVAVTTAVQDYHQLVTIMSESEAKSFMGLCRVIAILSCQDAEAANKFCALASQYKEEQASYTVGGKSNGSYNLSYQDKDILKPSDLMQTLSKQEVILFINGFYAKARVPEAQYFNLPDLNEISKRCVEENKSNKEVF